MIVVCTLTGRIAIPARFIWSIMEDGEFAVIRLVDKKEIYTTEAFEDVIDAYKGAVK